MRVKGFEFGDEVGVVEEGREGGQGDQEFVQGFGEVLPCVPGSHGVGY